MKTKLYIALAISLLQMSGFTFAQDSLVINSLKKNKFAIRVDGGYNFQAHTFDAVIFGLKYHLSNRSAIRLNVGTSFSNGFGRGYRPPQMLSGIDNSGPGGRFGNIGEKNFASLQYMFYPAPMKMINLYVGAGPRFGFGTSNSRHPGGTPIPVDMTEGSRHMNDDSWSLGLSGVLGTEWFATRSLSLFAEYDVAYSYLNRDMHIERDMNLDQHHRGNSDFGFTDLSARIGLSVYFDKPF